MGESLTQKTPNIPTNSFENAILKIVSEKDVSYVDAVLEYCTEHGMQPEYIKNIMTDPIKDKLEIEFRDVNLLPKLGNKLEFV